MSRERAKGLGKLRRVSTPSGHVYVLEYSDARGRRRRKRLGSDRRVAERLQAKIIRERDLAAAGEPQDDAPEPTLRELIERYLEDADGRCAASTAKVYRNVLERFQREFPARLASDVTPERFCRYREQRRRDGVSHSTLNRELDQVRRALRLGEIEGVLRAGHPLFRVQRLPSGPAYAKRRRRALSDDEIGALVAACRAADRERELRWSAARTIGGGTKGKGYAAKRRRKPVPQAPFWIAFLATGGRFGELTQATWGDLDPDKGHLTLRPETTKARRERVIPLRPEYVEELKGLRDEQRRILGREVPSTAPIFLTPNGVPWHGGGANARNRLLGLLEKAGIPRKDAEGRVIDIHALRHTFGSWLARSGVELVKTQKLMGHSTPTLTAQIYTHLHAEDLRGAIDCLGTRLYQTGDGADGAEDSNTTNGDLN